MNSVWFDRNDLESGFEMGRGLVSPAARSPRPRLRSVKKKSQLLVSFPQLLTSLEPLADGGMEKKHKKKKNEKGRIWFCFNPLHMFFD